MAVLNTEPWFLMTWMIWGTPILTSIHLAVSEIGVFPVFPVFPFVERLFFTRKGLV